MSSNRMEAQRSGGDGPLISRRNVLVGAIGAACVIGDLALGHRAAGQERSIVDGLLRPHDVPQGVFGVNTNERVVAMSFDDGPDPRYTARVLDLLETFHANATFFQIGVNALAHTQLTRAVLDAGHSIGNHTYDHPDLELLTSAEADREISRGATALMEAGAPRPVLFRPPKGLTDQVVYMLADFHRYRTVFWTLCLEAFVLHEDLTEGVGRMLARVQPGDVLLAHDGGHVVGMPTRPTLSRERTMAALPMLLGGLTEQGFRIVDVPRLLEAGPVRRHRFV